MNLKPSRNTLIISGPCSAESEEQVMQTVEQLKALGNVDFIRAGVWKPRTKPGMFEGVGEIALSWLQVAKRQFKTPWMVEVATAKHVELALNAGADALWIGARSTANPFSVQEIADALAKTNTPIYVKNPTNADVELWSGAIERLQNVQANVVGMIHRGFTAYGNSVYRNAPMWHLPIEMKRRYDDLEMICDPSHICGNRQMLFSVAQKSIDLNYDGLMIETHINPDKAWSDSKQQITPNQLGDLLQQLIWRNEGISNEKINAELEMLRDKIDSIDLELADLLSKRMKVSDEIGRIKKENNIVILQSERWQDITDKILSKADELKLTKEFLMHYLDAIHLESIHHQNNIMNKNDDAQ